MRDIAHFDRNSGELIGDVREQFGAIYNAQGEQIGVQDQYGQVTLETQYKTVNPSLPPAGVAIDPPGFRKFKGAARVPPTEDMLGHKTVLTRLDNNLAAALLVVNVINNWSVIFSYQVPVGQKLHFMPEAVNRIDRGCTAIMMLLWSATSAGILMRGRWMIKVVSADGQEDKGTVASGDLVEFGVQAVISADLTNIEQRVPADNEVWAYQGQNVTVSIWSPVVLVPATSDIFIKCARFNE